MKSRVLQSVVPIVLVVAFAPALCRAQAEIDPDHFDNISHVAAVAKTRTSNRKASQAYGSFFLPFDVTCAGVKLAPGYYSLSIRQLGRWDVVRMTRIVNGAPAHSLEVTATPRLTAEAPSGLVVDHVNQRRALTAISLQQLGVTLFLQPGKERTTSMNVEPIRISYSATQTFPANGE